ncbi:uncharacterized [Tachysurus ichikawai]
MEIVERKSQHGTLLTLKVMHYHNGTANPRSFQPQFQPVAQRKRVSGPRLLFLTPLRLDNLPISINCGRGF